MNQIEWQAPSPETTAIYREAIEAHKVANWEREQMALPDYEVEVVS